MIQELPVLHEHERVAPVQVADVGVHDDGDEARRGERLPALAGAEARPRDGCKEAETNGRSEWPARRGENSQGMAGAEGGKDRKDDKLFALF